MIMCVLLCYPVSIHMLQLLLTGHPISSFNSLYHSFLVLLTVLRYLVFHFVLVKKKK